MKITSTSLLVLTLGLSFTACGGDDNGDEGAGTDDDGSATQSTTVSTTVSTTADTGADDAPDTGADDAPDTGADDGGDMACVHTCAGDADCAIMGNMDFFVCDGGTCTNANPCTDDAFCIAQLSAWSAVPCTMGGGECAAAMQICVDLGDGTGGCASAPSEFFMCETVPGWAEVMATNLDDGSEVTVCGNPNAQCDTASGVCTSPCQDDTTCGEFVCNTDTGVCECDEDADCGEGGTCNADGTCSVPGCTSDADCENPFDGGTIACQ